MVFRSKRLRSRAAKLKQTLFCCVVIFLSQTAQAESAKRWETTHCEKGECVLDDYVIDATVPGVSDNVVAARSAFHLSEAEVLEHLTSKGTRHTFRIHRKPATGVNARSADLRTPEQFCSDLVQQHPSEVSACSPNYIVKKSATTPNDPSFSSLWGLSAASGIDAPTAWDYSTGSSDVVVAIIDTGIDYTHPDLVANLWHNPFETAGNGIDDDGNGVIDDVYGYNAITGSGDPLDDNGHGTHVAGTIGAAGNNGIGVVGVNWHVQIMALKFLDSSGSGMVSDAIKAINYMVAMKNRGVNIRVANNSWGGGGFSQSLFNAIQAANDAGIIFTAAAGNEANDNDTSPSYPASYASPNVVAVAAVDNEGNLADFSNYGGSTVGIGAPGVDILSTYLGGGYATLSGTSMATPHVTGALALLFSHEPNLSVSDAIARLYQSGKALSSLTGTTSSGRMLNVGRMLANETTSTPVVNPCPYAITANASSPDTSADNAPVAINADEMDYYTVKLPFNMPWEGTTVNSITVSPNGVVYMDNTPTGFDYQIDTEAPVNAFAPLWTDLSPVGKGYGVRVVVTNEHVTINWKAKVYTDEDGSVTVRATLHSNGTLESWYSFSDSTFQSVVDSSVTVGVHGASSDDVTTYSSSDGKIVDGLGLQFVPQCAVTQPSSVASSNAKLKLLQFEPVSGVTPGDAFLLSATGTGKGTATLQLTIGGQQCAATKQVSFKKGAFHLRGKLSKNFAGANSLTVKIGTAHKKVSIRYRTHAASARRMTSDMFSSLCSQIVNGLH